MSRFTMTPNARHRVPLAARMEIERLLDESPAAFVNVSARTSRGPVLVRGTHMVPAAGGGTWASPLFSFEGDPELVLRKAADALATYIESGVTA